MAKIVGYTDDVKNALIVTCAKVFDVNKPKDDPLAIWLRFDTLLNLQEEIEMHQKYMKKVSVIT